MAITVHSKQEDPHCPHAHKRHVLTLEERVKILKYFDSHPETSTAQLCHLFSSNRRTVRRILDNRESLLKLQDGDKRLLRTRFTKGTCLPVEYCVLKWMELAQFEGIPLSNLSLQIRTKYFFSLVKSYLPNVPFLTASSGWISRFKIRNAVDLKRLNELSKMHFVQELQPSRQEFHNLTHDYSPDNVFVLDTTMIFPNFIPTASLSSPHTSLNNCPPLDRLSMFLCTNASGNEKLIPAVIVPDGPSTIGTEHLLMHLIPSSSKWISAESFNSWLEYFQNFIGFRRKVLLLLDSHFSKCCPLDKIADNFPNVQVKFLPQRLSNFVQPFNLGICSSFKSHYRANLLAEVAFSVLTSSIDDFNNFQLPLVKSLEMIQKAWSQVLPSTVKFAWRRSQLLNSSSSFNPIDTLVEADPFSEELKRHPYLQKYITNYETMDSVYSSRDPPFPTEEEVLIVEEAVSFYLDDHLPELVTTNPKTCDLEQLCPPAPAPEKIGLNISPEVDFNPFSTFCPPADQWNFGSELALPPNFFMDQNHLPNISCGVSIQPTSSVESFPFPSHLLRQTSFPSISMESQPSVFSQITGLNDFGYCLNTGFQPPHPSVEQIHNVDMLLSLLRSHLSSSFGAPTEVEAALDMVANYVHRFDGNPN